MNRLDLTFWFGICTENVGSLNQWAAHTALASLGGSRVRGTSSIPQGLKQQTALSRAVMRLDHTRHWSTFKCNRTSNTTLQMFILASRSATKPAFFTLAALKATYVPKRFAKKSLKRTQLKVLYTTQSVSCISLCTNLTAPKTMMKILKFSLKIKH